VTRKEKGNAVKGSVTRKVEKTHQIKSLKKGGVQQVAVQVRRVRGALKKIEIIRIAVGALEVLRSVLHQTIQTTIVSEETEVERKRAMVVRNQMRGDERSRQTVQVGSLLTNSVFKQ